MADLKRESHDEAERKREDGRKKEKPSAGIY